MLRISSLFVALSILLTMCQSPEKSEGPEFKIDYEKYTLPNGLDVILHQDKSDPIVAVAIMMHVGSNREKPGRTGFAHFFEHMLFQKSENVEEGAFFKNINDLGGTFNGGTWNDGTVYYEVVPKDALERILWMESDRMGFFINAVTEADLEEEKPVVKNEKRERVDNVPYGHTNYVIDKALYPEGHPYNWQVIGELEDLEAATIEDVKEFYDKWYGPNNATMVLAGDFDPEEVKGLIEKYFGEIPARGEPSTLPPDPAAVEETKMLYHEDDFAKVPEIRVVFPTVEEYHQDSWALDALGEILSEGKRAPLYKVIVEEEELAPSVSAYNSSQEIAGKFTIRVRANEGVDLDTVKTAIFESLAKFEEEGFSEKDLQRIKARMETSFYNGLSGVLFKAFQLSSYNEFAGSPDFISEDINNILDITQQDVMDVYKKYIKDKNYIMTSFVPKGSLELIVDGSEKAEVKIEDAIASKGMTQVDEVEEQIVKTPSEIDRSKVPDLSGLPLIEAPEVYQASLSNGIQVYGIDNDELPLVNFSIRLKGGQLFDDIEKPGVANLVTDVMMEGTANKTPEELEDAIGQLGASINMYVSEEFITISANCLERYYPETMALVEEILLQPRWDEKEFNRLKKSQLNRVVQNSGNPNYISSNVSNTILYGEDHIFSKPIGGTTESVEVITLDDLKAYYEAYFSPNLANFHLAGAISKSEVMESLKNLESSWENKNVTLPKFEVKEAAEEPGIYFANYSDAKQSVVRVSRMAVSRTDEDYIPLKVANYGLGGNSGGKLFQVLREEKGYTYGAYSFVSSKNEVSPFTAYASVKTNVTPESVQEFFNVIGDYKTGYDSLELEKAKRALIRGEAREYETLGQKLGILQEMSSYNLPDDFIRQEQEKIKNLTVTDIQPILDEYMNMDEMSYILVGDASSQLERVRKLNLAKVIRVDDMGNPVDMQIDKN